MSKLIEYSLKITVLPVYVDFFLMLQIVMDSAVPSSVFIARATSDRLKMLLASGSAAEF